MHHEHVGECCPAHNEHAHHDHVLQMAGEVGSLCVAGQCHHIEHVQAFHEPELLRQLMQRQSEESESEQVEEKKTTTKVRRKKRGYLELVRISKTS